ncbi:MAG: transposase [bacterium]|nr:transposase [bacterium]
MDETSYRKRSPWIMHGPYFAAACPSHMSEAVDQVRRCEHKELKERIINSLTGTRYPWLKNPEDMEIERLEQLDALMTSCRKTARALAVRRW